MEETDLQSDTEELLSSAKAYLRERVVPHPALHGFLPEAAVAVVGSAAVGVWDEHSDFDLRFVLPDAEHTRLAAALQQAGLWDPARDFRLLLDDREPFRRFPGVQTLILSDTQLAQEFRANLPAALWAYSHAVVLQDPLSSLETALALAQDQFQSRLGDLRCEHYYRFREARRDLSPRISPRRQATILAIKRGEAVREALRLAFLAEGKPYPYDKWLETMAERETQSGAAIVTAVRALVGAREAHTVERAAKVLRDRVAFALQLGGVKETWLEQWWLWPSIAPGPE